MERDNEMEVHVTAEAAPGVPEAPAIAASPAVPVTPVAAAAAAVAAQAAAAKPKAARRAKPAGTVDKPVKAAAPAVADAKEAKADKPAKAVKAKKGEEPARDDKAPSKAKLVRDSFTMPHADFALIAQLKDRALGFKRSAKKSELLRAGLHALAALDDAKLQAALDTLAPVKTGRPKKG